MDARVQAIQDLVDENESLKRKLLDTELCLKTAISDASDLTIKNRDLSERTILQGGFIGLLLLLLAAAVIGLAVLHLLTTTA